jgi:hypothetical protein
MSFQSLLSSLSKREGDLYYTVLPNGVDIAFRLPSIKKAFQYRLLLDNALDDFHKYLICEHIFKNHTEDSLLHESEELHAGVVESIAGLILYLSGADNNAENYTEELLTIYRHQYGTLHNFMKRSICMVLHGYKFSDLENLTYQELIFLYTQVEPALIQQGIIEREISLKQEAPKPVSISQMISQDLKDYNKFENSNPAGDFNLNRQRAAQQEQQAEQIKAQQDKQRLALEKLKNSKKRRG